MKKYGMYICFLLSMQVIQSLDPKISIITSVYNGDEFIEEFLIDIIKQTIFDQCELIIINANSPGSEERIIQKYANNYSNIVYKRLDYDPGIYGVWNIAIKMSKGQYITNANLDDRFAYNCYEVYSRKLDNNPDAMLVYSDFYVTKNPHETFEKNTGSLVSLPKFERKHMHLCLPGCNPMWRKSLHGKYGYFDESYKSSGDYEMWLRAVEGGAMFKKISGPYALYYENPQGISTSVNTRKYSEDQRIRERYSHVWTDEAYDTYYELAEKIDDVCQDEQRAWSLALSYYLTAFSIRPHRAEPLIRIAQYYYHRGDMALTFLFAQRACELPEPKNVDQDLLKLYRYTRFDLLGIVAWYVGEYCVGEEAIKQALKYYSDDQRLHNNLKFYTNRNG